MYKNEFLHNALAHYASQKSFYSIIRSFCIADLVLRSQLPRRQFRVHAPHASSRGGLVGIWAAHCQILSPTKIRHIYCINIISHTVDSLETRVREPEQQKRINFNVIIYTYIWEIAVVSIMDMDKMKEKNFDFIVSYIHSATEKLKLQIL
jgi:hypothetical protein